MVMLMILPEGVMRPGAVIPVQVATRVAISVGTKVGVGVSVIVGEGVMVGVNEGVGDPSRTVCVSVSLLARCKLSPL
jgi:hypothetical protein